jgi:hypothetical protein
VTINSVVLLHRMQQTLCAQRNAHTEFFKEPGKCGRGRWLSIDQCPFSRAYTYRLLNSGLVASVVVTLPGSRRSRRLVDGDSLDQYLETLMAEQRQASNDKAASA